MSGAEVSTYSRTSWTRVPKAAPNGSPFISDAIPRTTCVRIGSGVVDSVARPGDRLVVEDVGELVVGFAAGLHDGGRRPSGCTVRAMGDVGGECRIRGSTPVLVYPTIEVRDAQSISPPSPPSPAGGATTSASSRPAGSTEIAGSRSVRVRRTHTQSTSASGMGTSPATVHSGSPVDDRTAFSRPKINRCSGPVVVFRDGAHQATTCDWARVSAT